MPVDAKLVADWIALQFTSENLPEHERLFWAFDVSLELVYGAPELAWEFILAVLQKDSSNKTLQNLSAGPLEMLLTHHGSSVIAKIEAEAKNNPLFATLLGGVWRNKMSDEIWERVQAVWDRRGWDGL